MFISLLDSTRDCFPGSPSGRGRETVALAEVPVVGRLPGGAADLPGCARVSRPAHGIAPRALVRDLALNPVLDPSAAPNFSVTSSKLKGLTSTSP